MFRYDLGYQTSNSFSIVLERKHGFSNAIFGQSEMYRRGRGTSIPAFSELDMRGGGGEKGLPDPCAPLVHPGKTTQWEGKRQGEMLVPG
jgi:hypothetical protein